MSEPTRPLTHEEVVELLPWLVNDTLSPAETRRVGEHLAHCVSCRGARASEQRLAAVLAEVPESEARIEAGLSRLRLALAREERRGWRRRQPTRRHLLAAVLVQGVVVTALLGFLAWLLRPATGPRFHTLSTPNVETTAAAGPRLRLVIHPGMRVSELRRMLVATGSRIVDGPSAAGVYTVEAQPGTLEETLRALRASRGVRLAEPLAATP